MSIEKIRATLDTARHQLDELETYEARKTRAMVQLVAQVAGHVTRGNAMSRENLVLEALHVTRVCGLETHPKTLRELLAVEFNELDIDGDENARLAVEDARRRLGAGRS